MSDSGKIKLAFHCPEKLEKMTPTENGKFCATCKKNIVDFRNRDSKSISKIIAQKEYTCGIFNAEQIQASKKYSLWTKIVTSIFISIGFFGFDKSLLAQENKTDSSQTQQNQVNEGIHITGIIAEIMPIYKNGEDSGLMAFLKREIKVGDFTAQEIIYTQFTVDTLGKTKDIKIIKGGNKTLHKEIIRVIHLLEFIPGYRGNKKAEIRYNLPIRINFKKEKE